jgi:nucleoside-diphosphate-sugar epimerase
MEPNTVYGISKLAGERWIEYYYNKYGVDTRSLRYPGLISYKTEAGGGTTDYAVEIYYEAIRQKKYTCFLGPHSLLPMMFMPDAIKATIDIMEADSSKLSLRSSYNVAGMCFNPEDVTAEIKKHIPEFEISYKPDFRQAIADSWPACINDSVARNDWGLTYEYDLPRMTEVMLREIRNKLEAKG